MKAFFLQNNKVGYFSQSKDNFTHYQGLCLFEDFELYKYVDNIDSYPKKNLFSFKKSNELIYEKKGEITIDLDVRKIHDFDDKGRIYDFNLQNNALQITYTKYEDDQLKKISYKKTFNIKNVSSFNQIGWIKKNYSYDFERKTQSTFWVLRIKIVANQPIFTFNMSSQKVSLGRSYKDKLFFQLKNLTYKNQILAGLPWFYQIWARDELIAITPYILRKEKQIVKNILLRQLERFENGLLKNRYPESVLGSIDAAGWFYFRLNQSKDFFTKKELSDIYPRLHKNIKLLIKNRMSEGLILNHPKETWMDTGKGYDERKGFRVEIQALFLTSLKCLNEIAKSIEEKPPFEELEIETKEKVKQVLFTDVLNDGFDAGLDTTTRPNVFIAHYVYPQLLSDYEWKITFKKVLNECWLDWGGLSSISNKSDLFQPVHTGINNKSYHRGDSWFWINNLAAISLKKLGFKEWKKIKSASLYELNNLGWKGTCAEISDAQKLASKGSLCQAWSISSLYELLEQN